jgi:hypothetical protein
MQFSNHRLDITGAARTWLQVAPWDHGLDEVLHPKYLPPNHIQFRN